MNIKTFKSEKYKECYVYYRNFGTHFEYLAVIDSQIYTAHIEVKPTKINLILCWLKIAPEKYSEQQTGNILKILRRLAETTIDNVLKKDKL